MSRSRPCPRASGLRRARVIVVVGLLIGPGCAPHLQPLVGEPGPASLPRAEMPPGHRQIIYDWDYSDPEMTGRGTGVARIASPDSIRLDFFLAGGISGGAVVLIGDSVQTPSLELTRRLLPPPTLLWAALGRSKIPVTSDTAIRRDGDFLRADLGRPVAWRVTFRRDTLIRLEHVQGSRIVEWMERGVENRIDYRQESTRRTLKLTITRVENGGEFDASIWHIDR